MTTSSISRKVLSKGFDMKTLISMINFKAKDKHSVYIYVRFQCSRQITASSLMTSEEREKYDWGQKADVHSLGSHASPKVPVLTSSVYYCGSWGQTSTQSINFSPVICLSFLRQGFTMTARLPCNSLASSASPAACSSPASAPRVLGFTCLNHHLRTQGK